MSFQSNKTELYTYCFDDVAEIKYRETTGPSSEHKHTCEVVCKQQVGQVFAHSGDSRETQHHNFYMYTSRLLQVMETVEQIIETVEQISIPLARVFNLSLKDGVVPFEWKETNIIPLF